MYGNDELLITIEEVEVLVAEIREFKEEGPHFRILHRFHSPGTDCAAGEEVAGVYLVYHGREFFVRLPLALRLLFDYLARHSHLPQSATQIEAGIRADQFYPRHAAATLVNGRFTRRIPRSYVRVYVERLRTALERASRETGLLMDPRAVLISQETVTNEVCYRLKAAFDWVHI